MTYTKFIRFLKEEKIYHLYKRNIAAYRAVEFIEDAIHQDLYISGAFDWASSYEGTHFWRNQHKKWLNELALIKLTLNNK